MSEKKIYIKASPELYDGSTNTIYKLNETKELGESIKVWAENFGDADYLPEGGEVAQLTLIALTDEEFANLNEE